MRKRIICTALTMLAFVQSPAVAKADGFKCPKAIAIAIQAGFTKKDLNKLDKIVYRESRCNNNAVGYNKRADGSVWSIDYGLTQINNYSWITYLRNLKIIKKSTDLLHPFTNMKAARALYNYSLQNGGDPWRQWRTSGNGSYQG
jgi:hypothetical protein